jgi:hypothetical protein
MSQFGTNAKYRSHRVLSEFGGEPENIYSHGVFRILTHNRRVFCFASQSQPILTQVYPHLVNGSGGMNKRGLQIAMASSLFLLASSACLASAIRSMLRLGFPQM